jgi:ring-1,2-phenylacetyl-CoA epoxidase subunit PaaC
LEEATLSFPIQLQGAWFQKGGKTGVHTEYMGFLLAEMQYLQKSYPGLEW